MLPGRRANFWTRVAWGFEGCLVCRAPCMQTLTGQPSSKHTKNLEESDQQTGSSAFSQVHSFSISGRPNGPKLALHLSLKAKIKGAAMAMAAPWRESFRSGRSGASKQSIGGITPAFATHQLGMARPQSLDLIPTNAANSKLGSNKMVAGPLSMLFLGN